MSESLFYSMQLVGYKDHSAVFLRGIQDTRLQCFAHLFDEVHPSARACQALAIWWMVRAITSKRDTKRFLVQVQKYCCLLWSQWRNVAIESELLFSLHGVLFHIAEPSVDPWLRTLCNSTGREVLIRGRFRSELIGIFRNFADFLFCGFRSVEFRLTDCYMPMNLDIDALAFCTMMHRYLIHYVQNWWQFVSTNKQVIVFD